MNSKILEGAIFGDPEKFAIQIIVDEEINSFVYGSFQYFIGGKCKSIENAFNQLSDVYTGMFSVARDNRDGRDGEALCSMDASAVVAWYSDQMDSYESSSDFTNDGLFPSEPAKFLVSHDPLVIDGYLYLMTCCEYDRLIYSSRDDVVDIELHLPLGEATKVLQDAFEYLQKLHD